MEQKAQQILSKHFFISFMLDETVSTWTKLLFNTYSLKYYKTNALVLTLGILWGGS